MFSFPPRPDQDAQSGLLAATLIAREFETRLDVLYVLSKSAAGGGRTLRSASI